MVFDTWIKRERFPATKGLIMLGFSIVAVAVALGVSLYALKSLTNAADAAKTRANVAHATAVTNCKSVTHLYQVLYLVTYASAKSLGAKGTAGYIYYKEHPRELASGRKAAFATARAFLPPKC